MLPQWAFQTLSKISIQLQELNLTFTYLSIKGEYDKYIHAWEYFEKIVKNGTWTFLIFGMIIIFIYYLMKFRRM